VLTPAHVRDLYGVIADVTTHPRAGHLTVVPLGRASDLRRRLLATVAGFGALTIAVCLTAPLIGSTPIHLSRVFDRTIPFADNVDAQVFFVARLPRVLASALVGSAFAIAGVVFQAFLRNPLASPDTLGVSSGATLGAVVVITFHIDTAVLGVSAVPVATFAGAAGAPRHRLRDVDRAPPRHIQHRAAAGRRRPQRVPWGIESASSRSSAITPTRSAASAG
jgi:hypothetical protein